MRDNTAMKRLYKKTTDFFRSKRFRYGSNSILITVFFIGILLVANGLVDSRLKWKIDLTKDKVYTLTAQSVDFVKTIDKDVKITCFYPMGQEPKDLANILNDYRNNSNRISVRFVDPDKEPIMAAPYAIDGGSIGYNMVIVESGNRQRKIYDYDFYDMRYIYSDMSEPLYSKIEQKITSAISSVVSERDIKIYFLQGHGEMSDESIRQLQANLTELNYSINSLNLMNVKELPDDVDVLVALSPKMDLSSEDIDKLSRYLERGGRMLLCFDVFSGGNDGEIADFPNFNILLENYGIKLENAVVLEMDPTMVLYNNALALLPEIQDTEVSSNIILKNLNTVFSLVRNITISDKDDEDIVIKPIAKTSKLAWGETNIQSLRDGSASRDSADLEGPLTIAIIVEKQTKIEGNRNTRLLVYGNASFLSDDEYELRMRSGNNDLILNSFNWLAEQQNAIIVPVKDITQGHLTVSSSQARLIFITVLLVPLIILSSGIGIWIRRRRA